MRAFVPPSQYWVDKTPALSVYAVAHGSKHMWGPAMQSTAHHTWTLVLLSPCCFVVQFPDPHWKAKHKKRRIVQPALVQTIRDILRPGGEAFDICLNHSLPGRGLETVSSS